MQFKCPWCSRDVDVDKYSEHYESCPVRLSAAIDERIEKHFSSIKAKPLPVSSVLGINEVKAYSSHGEWSTLSKIRAIETERGNKFPDLPDYTHGTPAIWVCLTKRLALRYLESADQWDRLMSDSPLTKEDEECLLDISEVALKPSDVIAYTDFDQGYLILRPPAQSTNETPHLVDYAAIASDVPDTNDPAKINYWLDVDKYKVYVEGWCDKCFAGTGMGEYETQAKLNYAEDLSPKIFEKKQMQTSRRFLEGRFIETPDKDFIVGVTIGVFLPATFETSPQTRPIAPKALMDVDPRVRARLSPNLEEARREYAEYGEWWENVFEPAVPISQIELPPPWNEYRYKDNYRRIGKTKKMPPAFLSFNDSTHTFKISDGIHRTNAAKDLGYTGIPAVAAYRRTTPP